MKIFDNVFSKISNNNKRKQAKKHDHESSTSAINQQPSASNTSANELSNGENTDGYLAPMYMYSMPDDDDNGNRLRHLIAPHTPSPIQYHKAAQEKQQPVRIRTIKTGMQKLAEHMDQHVPRSRSPHMNNEEPIELSHYASGCPPTEGQVKPIECDSFAQNAYCSDNTVKHRPTSTLNKQDIDSDDDDSTLIVAEDDRLKRNINELDKYKDESNIARVLRNNIEKDVGRSRRPLHSDPRNASRTASAKRMPPVRCRYPSPIFASPSRSIDRPKPWVEWNAAKQQQQQPSKTATLSTNFSIPIKARYNTSSTKAATLPHGYKYNTSAEAMTSGATSTHLTPLQHQNGATLLAMKRSMPDMTKAPKIYSIAELQTTNQNLPKDVDRKHLEWHLNRAAFEQLFSMTPIEFYRLPEWKRIQLKRKVNLF